jgi:molybdopterin molybdotransferase
VSSPCLPAKRLQVRDGTAVFGMLELEEAVARILQLVPPPRPEEVSLEEAHGRVAFEAVPATVDLPGFDNSAMDGYAARAEDLLGASIERPVKLRVAGKVAAGQVFASKLSPGFCVRLFTGSPLPDGADCVVMQEDTRIEANDPEHILILDTARPWENVRFKGEDIRIGAPLIQPGQTFTAGRLCLLAATGRARVLAAQQPNVGLIATGSELREAGERLGPGQIFESNRVGLASLARAAGAKPVMLPLVSDTFDATEQALGSAFAKFDIVVSAGGASVGDLDLIKPVFKNLGGELDFWKVSLKPGRPFLFGRHQGRLFFGLPGNPISALVTFLLLVRPAIRRFQGGLDCELPSRAAALGEDLVNTGSRRHFVRVRVNSDGIVNLAGTQGSHLLSSFAEADGLVDVPAETTLKTGSPVRVRNWTA